MSNRPLKPIEAYEKADQASLPPVPPVGLEGEPAGAGFSPPEIAALKFLDPSAVTATVPLDFPFEFEGREIRIIHLRRLSMAEVGDISDRLATARLAMDLYEFYGPMAGLPAAVIRGLIDDDGEAFIQKARPLLPRYLRQMLNRQEQALRHQETRGSASPTPSDAGDVTPSPPPAP